MYWWDMYWWDTFAIPADAHLLNGYALNGYASHGYILVGYVLKEKVLVGYVLVGYVLNGYVCKTDANLLNGYALNGYVLVGYVLNGYVLVGYVLVGYVLNGYVWDMCGICVMCWICVGYVWCEIRQQSSEEPCDETSFGKKRYKDLFTSTSCPPNFTPSPFSRVVKAHGWSCSMAALCPWICPKNSRNLNQVQQLSGDNWIYPDPNVPLWEIP